MNNKPSSIALVLILSIGAAVLVTNVSANFLAAQEDEAEARDRDRDDRGEDLDPEQLERRLDQIEELIEQAEEEDDRERIRELRREGERILDQLEEIERSRDEDADHGEHEELERHLREIEIHRLELEVQRMHLELDAVRQEAAVRLAQISADQLKSAAYAVFQTTEGVEAEEAIDLLRDLQEQAENKIIRRMIRHRLVSLYRHTGQPDAAREQLRALILNE